MATFPPSSGGHTLHLPVSCRHGTPPKGTCEGGDQIAVGGKEGDRARGRERDGVRIE